MSKLVKCGRIHSPANTIGLSSAVSSQQIGSGVARGCKTVVGLAIIIVQASVSIRGLILSVIDALPVCALVHAKGARISNVAVHLAVASVAFNSGRTALAVEANGSTLTLFIFLANLTILFQILLEKRRINAEAAAAKAHDLYKPSLIPCRSIGGAVVHALVVAGKASVLESGAAFEKATRFARRFYNLGTVLVVRNLMQGEAALFVCGIGAVGVRSSRRNGAFARGVDEGVAVEHVESLTLHSASHLETASDWVWALFVALFTGKDEKSDNGWVCVKGFSDGVCSGLKHTT